MLLWSSIMLCVISAVGSNLAFADLEAIGTAYEYKDAHSPVWFTFDKRGLKDVRYPTPNLAQIEDLDVVLTDSRGFLSELKKDTVSQIRYRDEGMSILVSGDEKSGRYHFEQEFITDAFAPVLRIRTRLSGLDPDLRVFVRLLPSIDGSRVGNIGNSDSSGLSVTAVSANGNEEEQEESEAHLALISTAAWKDTSAAFTRREEEWREPENRASIIDTSREAGPGELTLSGELSRPPLSEFTFEIAVAFGSTAPEAAAYAETSLRTTDFDSARAEYENGWKSYLSRLQETPGAGRRFMRESSQARRSAELLKMHEDKRRRGLLIQELENEDTTPSSLYGAASALLAAGDYRTPQDTLERLIESREQLTAIEASYAILLTELLRETGARKPGSTELEFVRDSVERILSAGPGVEPTAPAPRHDPSDLAIKIAALRAAARLLQDNGPENAAVTWMAQIERWTWKQSSENSRSTYASGVDTGPDSRYGFLELVRLGLRHPQDPRILSSLLVGVETGTTTSPSLHSRRGLYAVQARDPDGALAHLHRLENAIGVNGLSGADASRLPSLSGLLLLHSAIENERVFDSPPALH